MVVAAVATACSREEGVTDRRVGGGEGLACAPSPPLATFPHLDGLIHTACDYKWCTPVHVCSKSKKRLIRNLYIMKQLQYVH